MQPLSLRFIIVTDFSNSNLKKRVSLSSSFIIDLFYLIDYTELIKKLVILIAKKTILEYLKILVDINLKVILLDYIIIKIIM